MDKAEMLKKMEGIVENMNEEEAKEFYQTLRTFFEESQISEGDFDEHVLNELKQDTELH